MVKKDRKTLCVLGTKSNGWTKEVCIVEPNSGSSSLHIREWSPEGEMGKGIALNKEEVDKLTDFLKSGNTLVEDTPKKSGVFTQPNQQLGNVEMLRQSLMNLQKEGQNET